MKIAIFHNYLNNIGGAERVSLILARELQADLYSTVVDHNMIHKLGFDLPVTPIGWIPDNPPLRQQLASWRFRHFRTPKEYDAIIIAGDWALSAAVNHHPSIWYCHSPSRELWDLYAYTRQTIVPRPGRQLFDAWVHFNRRRNRSYADQVDQIVSSSRNAQQRCKKYLGRSSTIIYPPVDTDRYSWKPPENYWLSVNRLLPYKQLELQFKAFSHLPHERLIVVGSLEPAFHFQQHAAYLKRIKPANVTLMHWVPEAQLKTLYAQARGLVATSFGEDFGLVAVEAMAAGKPVVAVRDGGYQETVIDGVTGALVEPNVTALIDAITHISPRSASYRGACQDRAQDFSTQKAMAAWHTHLHELA